ncbi:hypothetical protein DFH27DRAFT_616842 [Peziza echinospora]|nr:hypothetical protein DFH27DRAFT_616842 [Peziza echinospora]
MHHEPRRTAFVGESHHRLPASTKPRVHYPIPDMNNNNNKINNNNTATGMSSPPNTNLDIQLRDITGRTATLAHTQFTVAIVVQKNTPNALAILSSKICQLFPRPCSTPVRGKTDAGLGKGMRSMYVFTSPRQAGGEQVGAELEEKSPSPPSPQSLARFGNLRHYVPHRLHDPTTPTPTRQYTSKSTRTADSGTTSTREIIIMLP